MPDPFKTKEWKRHADRLRKELIPKMRDSAVTLIIGPDLERSDFDIDFAVQIGAAILLEKPLLVVVPEGRVLPPKLAAVADRVIVLREEKAATQDEIRQFMIDFAKQ
jgi:hypothetical protein